MTKNMKISIITASFNSVKTIESCINSVLNQDYSHVEYIVIDAKSTDGTINIIRRYEEKVDVFIIEKDTGMYDALNKGISNATGDIIGFLHSDDFYKDRNVLSKVANVLKNSDIDACYGDLVYIKEKPQVKTNQKSSQNEYKFWRYWKSGAFNAKKFYWGWMPPHPTFFVRRSVYEKYGGFNLSLGSSADYELMLRFLLKCKIKVAYIPEVLVCMRTGGVSNVSLKNRYHANRMDKKAWEVNGLKPYYWTFLMKPFRKIPQYLCKPFCFIANCC